MKDLIEWNNNNLLPIFPTPEDDDEGDIGRAGTGTGEEAPAESQIGKIDGTSAACACSPSEKYDAYLVGDKIMQLMFRFPSNVYTGLSI